MGPATPTSEELRAVVQAFGDAASRAEGAGFDGVQVHTGHGFFLSQFLSAEMNTRTDEYGGAVGNRVRLLLQVCAEIQARTSRAFTVLVKINCLDLLEGDGVWEACKLACSELTDMGISAIEITGGLSGAPFPPAGLPYGESVFRNYAAEVAETMDVPLILVGLNRIPAVFEHLLATT